MSAVLLPWLVHLNALVSAALLCVLVLRSWLRRWAGAGRASAVWGLIPLALLASALPRPAGPAPLPTWPGPATGPAATAWAPTVAVTGTPAGWWVGLWLAGLLASAGWLAWQQWRFQRRLGPLRATGLPLVHTAPRQPGAGPMLVGLWQPKIVVPADFAERYTPQEQDLILAHERAHRQRGDVPAQALACALQAVFWFNPLVHWAASRFRLDQELACDEAVVRAQPHSRPAYATAMLKTQLQVSALPLGCHWQARHPLKERVMHLARSPAHRWQRTAATLTMSAAALAGAYGAWAQSPQGGASAAPGAAGRGAYRVELSVTKKVGDDSTQRVQLEFAAAANETLKVFPDLANPARLGCEVSITLQPQPNDQVSFELPFQCTTGGQAHPKLRVALGQPGTVEVGEEGAPGQPGYRLTFVVTVRRAAT